MNDLSKIISHLRQFDPTAADKYSARLIELGESLSELPDRGRPTPSGDREMAIGAPDVLTYRTNGREVMILRVRHGRQRPLA